jgi:pilus assembly protein CpaB
VRRISPGTVTIGVMAILFGLVAAYVIRQSMDQPEVITSLPPEPPARGQRVVVATVNLVKNSMVSGRQVRVTYVPEEKELPEGAFRYAPPVIGRYLKSTVKAGQAITEDMLLPIGVGLPGLDEDIPEGHRAMTLTLDNTNLQKLIKVGSFVDVTLTVEGEHPALGGVMTETLLRRLRVIDIDDSKVDPRRSRAPEKLNVTLAATPRECNVMITAQQRGSLGLTLVSPHEAVESDEGKDQVRFDEIVNLPPILKPVEPEKVLPPAPYVIESFSGGHRTVVELPHSTIEESRRAAAASPVSINPAGLKTSGDKPATDEAALIPGTQQPTSFINGN